MLNLRLHKNKEKRLKLLAKAVGRTEASIVREAILKHLDDLEDIHFSEQALAEIHAGRVKTIPLEEVMRELGMVDSDGLPTEIPAKMW